MKIVICDITGRTINYDVALCEEIYNQLEDSDSVEFWSAGLTQKYVFKCHLFKSLVPQKYRSVAHAVTRVLKALDTILAYIWILFKLRKDKIDVLHLQWLPFISLGLTGSSIDLKFLSILKKISPNTRLIFTIHNMCPHRMNEEDRKHYNPTFIKALNNFDAYVVHTEGTKDEVVDVLELPRDKVFVIFHGIFSTNGYTFKEPDISGRYINLLMYGFQHSYKGTDIFVEALSLLNEDTKNKINVKICGAFGSGYLERCQKTNSGIDIKWIPEFLSDSELFKEIDNADILLFPYRRISQSGALLLALYTRKYIITSNLPTFKETLKGFPEELFFKSECPSDLTRVIELYCSGIVNVEHLKESIENLNTLYSWNKSADNTINLYKLVINNFINGHK